MDDPNFNPHLQMWRYSSSMQKSRGAKAFLFHVVATLFYVGVFIRLRANHSDDVPTDIPMVKTARSFFPRFFTIWTFVLQGTYFAISAFTFLLGMVSVTRKLSWKLEQWWSYFAVCVLTPSALLVSVVFWGIYTIDRRLILPEALDVILPPWLNHSIHTVNAVLALMDLYIIHHPYPNFSGAVKGLVSYLALYCICLYGTFFQMGIWIYPFLEAFTPLMHVGFSLGSALCTICFYFLSKFISQLFWGSSPSEKVKKPIKKKRF